MADQEEHIARADNPKPAPKSTLIRLDSPKFYTRIVHLRADQGYGIGRTALIKRWRIITPDVRATMTINGVPIILDGLDGRTFDIAYIRQALRDIMPMSSEENLLCAAEATLFGTQLLAVEFYRYFKAKHLFDLLFTGDLCVTFSPTSSTGVVPDKIDIEEEVAFSEVQLMQRLAAGETLEQMDANNHANSGTTVELSLENTE